MYNKSCCGQRHGKHFPRCFPTAKNFIMRMWRNWQTRTFEGRVVYSIWVQVPSSAPKEERVPMVLSLLFFSMGLEGRAPAGSIAVRQNFGGRNSTSQDGKCCVIGFAAPPAGKFILCVKAALSFFTKKMPCPKNRARHFFMLLYPLSNLSNPY